MSHQTGIQFSDELRAFVNKCKSTAKSRVIKIAIKDEQLALDEHNEPDGKWQEDYGKLVPKLLFDKQPCYVLFRLDTKNSSSQFDWLLITWSPEGSPVREKMLYASTKASLKKEFGNGSISYDFFVCTAEEASLPSFEAHMTRKQAEESGEQDESLLTAQERDLALVKSQEALTSSINKSNRTLPGVEFPISEEGINALFDLKDGLISYLQLAIDSQQEVIHLEKKESHKEFDIKDMASKVPGNSPRYHLILWPHTHNGLFHKSTIFVYSVPSSNCTVKEKMLYSTCKSALLMAIQDRVGIELAKKIECDDASELTVDFFLDELHPKEAGSKKQFEKPKGPAGKRGGKRLIKTDE
ncbi:Twinfilin-2 [Halotydeus destructor]|nr:Twinfilin-2 [Halotydeus destructor]